MTERFDALVQMLTQSIRGESSDKVTDINRIGREQWALLQDQRIMLEGLLQTVIEQQRRFAAWAPPSQDQNTPMPRIVKQAAKEQSNG